jgi:hypothetical protein
MQPQSYNKIKEIHKPKELEQPDLGQLNHAIWLALEGTVNLLNELESKYKEISHQLCNNTLADERVLRSLTSELNTLRKTINLVRTNNYE